tara:strand:- start:753 stop:1343 length:591 start_codon:yes stop_codon:yes gene_type:complete
MNMQNTLIIKENNMVKKLPKEMNEFTEYEPIIRHKEIDLIQSTITRLADNQIKVKGLCISMLAFFAWIFKVNNPTIGHLTSVLLASIVTTAMCYKLDFAFLKTERTYRMWFEFLQDRRSETKAWLFELNLTNIICILKDQVHIPDQFNPNLLKRKLQKNWSLQFYIFLVLIIGIIYLPACFAAASTQSTKLLLMLS